MKVLFKKIVLENYAMKKVLCFIDNLGSGGAQRQLVNTAIMLKNEGYEIEFVIYNDNMFFKKHLDEAGIGVELILAKNMSDRVFKVRKRLKKSDADVVIAYLETPGFLACLSKGFGTKWKLITSERSAKESTFRGKRHAIFNRFERRSNYKVCNSNNAKNMWKEHFPKYEKKLRVIYNPVIMPEMPAPVSCGDGKLHIVVAASYQKLKNSLGVIEALKLLGEEERNKIKIDWYGRIVVDGTNRTVYDESVRRIEEYKLAGCIELHEDTNDIYTVMNNADVVGLFSTVEGLPNAICEGMMLGKPIVMSRVSDYDVLTEENGILCDTDPESIARALEEIVNLPKEKLHEMGLKSKEKAEKLFGREHIIKQWIELIED